MNEELLRLVKQSAAELVRSKQAVVPAGGPPGMDPAAAGGAPPPGMDPAAMGGAPPPGMDPAAAAGGAPPPGGDPTMGATDPALAAAGGGPQDMIRQIVQQVLAEQGGGKPGMGAKGGKPDVAVELQRLNENFHKLGVLVTQLAKKQGVEVTPAMLFGQPPDTVDPALAAASAEPMSMTPGSEAQGETSQDGAGAPAYPFPPPPGLSGDPAESIKGAAFDAAAIAKAAAGIREALSLETPADFDPLLETSPADFTEAKTAEVAPVGHVVENGQLGMTMQQPLALARMFRERARGR